jgi:hypothetical protein
MNSATPCPAPRPLNSSSNSSKSENPTGHEIQELHSSTPPPKIIILNPQNQLDAALIRFGENDSRSLNPADRNKTDNTRWVLTYARLYAP